MRVDATTVCGTDLHILKGDVPAVEPGRILGHEAVGTVEDVGSAVAGVRPGDRVLVSCITACGRCRYCRTGAFGQCLGGGGWILGHRIDGTQAEYVRVPFADTSTHRVPSGVSDEAVLMLADILPTSYEVGVLNGAVQAVAELTEGLGADVAVEAVGVPETFELCARLARPGGHIANVGVHGKPATLHLEDLWIRNVTITTGLVDTYSTPTLLCMLAAGRFDASRFVTHRFGLQEMQDAYDVFSRPQETGALKIALFRR